MGNIRFIGNREFSYAQDLADKLSRDCRRIVASDWHQGLFPTQLSPQRQAANEWYDHTLYSRLDDKLAGAIVLIMHRLHESLPSGVTRGTISPGTCWRRSRGRSCACRRLPMEASSTGSRRCSGISPSAAAGQALHAEREPLPMLEQIRRTIGMSEADAAPLLRAWWTRV